MLCVSQMKIATAGKRTIWVVAVAIVLTIIFHRVYPYTDISPALETVIVLVAVVLVFVGNATALLLGKRSGRTAPPAPRAKSRTGDER